ncbi:uncharacterized protein LOC126890135 [Diabrotica virgifera virgifera]|uniref:THAP-type domain-containing protein n=1 Tax=Diabrotica virgifera virgifera TaxID=50390 RepID=A0ABM5KXN8_DIAVI|nr:uncharacterized protein LOC126890135 [Diabrotica virgifera virgifera]
MADNNMDFSKKKTRYCSCCIDSCKNTGYNSDCKFYSFPVAKHKIGQREKWIIAINKKNEDGSLWTPNTHHLICSDHFVGGEKSDAEMSPSYVPSLFGSQTLKARYVHNIDRHSRFMKRRIQSMKTSTGEILGPTKDCEIASSSSNEISVQTEEYTTDNLCEIESFNNSVVNSSADKSCQVFIWEDDDGSPKPWKESFVCIKYVHKDSVDVEIQTDISGDIDLVTARKHKKLKNKMCGTDHKTYADVAVGLNEPIIEEDHSTKKHKCFNGHSSIKNEEELLDLTGVSFHNFNLLLEKMEFSDKIVISKENKLFILLMKLKTGLTFAAMGALFRIHRTTISKIFFSCLQQLAYRTSNFVFWPEQETVRASIPDCFKRNYDDTRAIIDCTEFRIEIPSSLENRVFCYSQYKHGFTFKVLFGITPSGFISFKSDAHGGRISDSHITATSGLINLLEHGDKILADKCFPEFQNVIDDCGKKILFVMPPFLKDKLEFTKEETDKTYDTARVRIHVERVMQRLRTFRVLDKIPEYLFSHIDEVIHLCCVLVNLQPPIISEPQRP